MESSFFTFLYIALPCITGLCPDVWTQFHGSCYFLFEAMETWDQANSNCLGYKGHLVTIESKDESTFVEYLTKSRQVTPAEVWIGARRINNKFLWAGSNDTVDLTDWAPGNPSGGFFGETEPEDCVEINRWLGYKWNDRACLHKNHYICETRPHNDVVG